MDTTMLESRNIDTEWKWLQSISRELFREKYMLQNESTVDEVFRGVAKEISSVENPIIREEIEEKFYNVMKDGDFIPAGRILSNARPNSPIKNYNNCFTIAIEDSMDGIYDALKEDALISKVGGGVGFDISSIRPKGSPLTKGGEASGPISFLKIFNQSAKTIKTGGARRCLPKCYSVLMKSGKWEKITDLKVNDEILFENNSYKIKNIFNNGIQKLIKILTNEGYHLCTENHKWYVYNNSNKKLEWVTAKEILKNKNIKYSFLRLKW